MKLLECPSCNSERAQITGKKTWCVWCPDCGMRGGRGDNEVEAIEWWSKLHRRAGVEAVKNKWVKATEEIGELKKRLQDGHHWGKKIIELTDNTTIGPAVSTLKAEMRLMKTIYKALGSDPLKDLLSAIQFRSIREDTGSDVYEALNNVFRELAEAKQYAEEQRERAWGARVELDEEKERVWRLVQANESLINGMATVIKERPDETNER